MNLQTLPAFAKRIVCGSLRRATSLVRLLQPVGGGYHFGIGVGIARLKAQLFVRAILAQCPQIRAAESGMLVYYPSLHQRGLAKLMVYPS